MPTNTVLPPYAGFPDSNGLPLENGQIFIGQPGFEARTTPKASFFDLALTIPTGTASGSAIRTRGGFPARNGAPSAFYVDGDYSITVLDRNGVLLYTALNNTLAINVGAAAGQVLGPDGNLAAVGIGFTNEGNTGWVRSAPGTVQDVVTGVVVSQRTTAGTVFQQPVSGAGFTSGVLGLVSGRNRIINGQGRVNQRGYVSGTATSGANEYTLDRWRVVTSGQSLTFTGDNTRRTMTAPAGGCEQVIEGINIEGGTYTINWTGTATCQVDGTGRAKGATFTGSFGTAMTVRFIGGTFTDVQVELGTVPSVFDRLAFSDEIARCQRYYWLFNATAGYNQYMDAGRTNCFMRFGVFPVQMRVAPSASFGAPTYTNCSALSIFTTPTVWTERVTTTAAGPYIAVNYVPTFDAEL